MTLGALAAAIGLIIDDAIVVVEQIHRAHEEHPDAPTSTLLSTSIRYLFPAMIGSSASTIVIFFPFVLMSGVAGAYFKVMTDAMIITLVCSFLVTWLLLPVVYLLFSREKTGKMATAAPHDPPAARGWIRFFIRRAWLSILFVIGLVGLVFLRFSKIGNRFFA